MERFARKSSVSQLLLLHRLGQKARRVDREAVHDQIRVAGDKDDIDAAVAGAQAAGKGHAVDAGGLDIQQHGVVPLESLHGIGSDAAFRADAQGLVLFFPPVQQV